ncbi:MAG: hypothetical protein GY928_33670 [Colwellia sp.]|nr:hypothetical protein [Colwellia sp.]
MVFCKPEKTLNLAQQLHPKIYNPDGLFNPAGVFRSRDGYRFAYIREQDSPPHKSAEIVKGLAGYDMVSWFHPVSGIWQEYEPPKEARKEELMEDYQLTGYERKTKRTEIDNAINLLRVASVESKTATPKELLGTIDDVAKLLDNIRASLKPSLSGDLDPKPLNRTNGEPDGKDAVYLAQRRTLLSSVDFNDFCFWCDACEQLHLYVDRYSKKKPDCSSEDYEPPTDDEIADYGGDVVHEEWTTVGVFFSRKQANEHGKQNEHNLGTWRSWAVPAYGGLARLLQATDEMPNIIALATGNDEKLKRQTEVLKELDKRNPLRNDSDQYELSLIIGH